MKRHSAIGMMMLLLAGYLVQAANPAAATASGPDTVRRVTFVVA